MKFFDISVLIDYNIIIIKNMVKKMSKENIRSETENKYIKLPENPEILKEGLKLFPSQKEFKEKYLENMKNQKTKKTYLKKS